MPSLGSEGQQLANGKTLVTVKALRAAVAARFEESRSWFDLLMFSICLSPIKRRYWSDGNAGENVNWATPFSKHRQMVVASSAWRIRLERRRPKLIEFAAAWKFC